MERPSDARKSRTARPRRAHRRCARSGCCVAHCRSSAVLIASSPAPNASKAAGGTTTCAATTTSCVSRRPARLGLPHARRRGRLDAARMVRMSGPPCGTTQPPSATRAADVDRSRTPAQPAACTIAHTRAIRRRGSHEAAPTPHRFGRQARVNEHPREIGEPSARVARTHREDASGVSLHRVAREYRYAELHCLSNFSFQRGASSASELFERAHRHSATAHWRSPTNARCAGIVRALEARKRRARIQRRKEPAYS